ncbi:C6orf222 isoform 1 [Pongo abelii]|uniref:BCL2 interacting protein 5 n=1 Tax=Pongo abelii TaxID=9601 RepID=H2PIV1_PONAB|nr:C6orf222 isoform 1 [Pongo abelii]
MENPRCPRRSLAEKKARSLDRPLAPGKGSESWDCHCLSLPTAPSRKALHWTTSDWARHSDSPAPSAEAHCTTAAAPTPEETGEFLPSEQRPSQDTKKGWLKTVLNFFMRTGPEEPREKASRRPRGKEGISQPPEPLEAAGEPALRKKAHHDKKASRKKQGHKKHVAEVTKAAQDQEARGQEEGLSKAAAALHSGEADLGPARRGGEDSDHQSFLIEVDGAGALDVSPHATGHQQEEELKKPDQDAIIQMIVELLKRVGDQWEEEQSLASQLGVALPNPAPAVRKKSQEKKTSLKRTSKTNPKKHGSEEAKRGAADVSSPEARPPKKSGFLPLCVGGHRPSISSSYGLEEPEVQEAPSTEAGAPGPSVLPTPSESREPGEELPLDRPSEYKEFIQKIISMLQDAEEQQGEEQPQVQEEEVGVENPAPHCRRKSQEKKSNFRRAFYHKKHSSKEPRRAGAAGAASPEARRPKRPSFLPLCVGGHRPSTSSSLDPEDLKCREPLPAEGEPVVISEAPSQARGHTPEGAPQLSGARESKEIIIQKLVALLQEVDGQLGQQIRRHPSFKRFFYEFSDSSLSKLVATLRSQVAHSSKLDRNHARRLYQFDVSLANKFAGNNSHAMCILMGLRDHYNCTQFPYREDQLNITSPEVQSPD